MRLCLQYSGQIAALAGRGEEDAGSMPGKRLRDVLAGLAADGRDPGFGKLLLTAEGGIQPTLLLVVDGEQWVGEKNAYVPDDGATVFLMSPIAGG